MTTGNGSTPRKRRLQKKHKTTDNGAPKEVVPKKKPAAKKKRPARPKRKRQSTVAKRRSNTKSLNHNVELWLQQPKETNQAYQAFTAYRDLQAHERSLRMASVIVKKSRSLIDKWSSRWSWVIRCKSWDNEKERAALQANLAEIVAMRKKQAVGAATIQMVLLLPALTIMQEIEADPLFLSKSLRDDKGEIIHSRVLDMFAMVTRASKVFAVVADVERLARGEPTLITEVRVTSDERPAEDPFSNPATRKKALELFEEVHELSANQNGTGNERP